MSLAIVLIKDYFRNQQENQKRHYQIRDFIQKRKLGDELSVDALPHLGQWTISTILAFRKHEGLIEEAICIYEYKDYKVKIVIINGIVVKMVK